MVEDVVPGPADGVAPGSLGFRGGLVFFEYGSQPPVLRSIDLAGAAVDVLETLPPDTLGALAPAATGDFFAYVVDSGSGFPVVGDLFASEGIPGAARNIDFAANTCVIVFDLFRGFAEHQGSLYYFGASGDVFTLRRTAGAAAVPAGGDGGRCRASDVFSAGPYAYFVKRTFEAPIIHELFRSDGTTAVQVPSTGPLGTFPTPLAAAGSRLIYVGDSTDGNARWLWGTDGTSRQLLLGGAPGLAVSLGDRAYFGFGNQLWVTDGTPGGTAVVASLPSAFPRFAWGGRLLVSSHTNTRLWILDPPGTLTELGAITWPRAVAPTVAAVAPPFSPHVYFACEDAAHGVELCRTDGTMAGTGLVADIRPGPESSSPALKGASGARVFFTADDGVHGVEPWALGDSTAVSVGNAAGDEPQSSATLTFHVRRAPATGTVTVSYRTVDGTARAGEDYDPAAGTLTFAPGIDALEVPVVIRPDGKDGPAATFFLELHSPVGAVLANTRGAGRIADADSAPFVRAGDGATAEGTGAGGTGTVTFRLSEPSEFVVTVTYATSPASAQAGADYVASAGTVTFSPGSTMRTVTFPIVGDTLDEPHEAFTVTITGAGHAYIDVVRQTAQVTILDDDGRPGLCRPIAYVPYVITTQGRYCLARSLSMTQELLPVTHAVEIQADFVTLDLRGFKLGAGSLGPSTLAVGVYAAVRSNITVRNGNIRGFAEGVVIGGPSSKANVVEDLLLDSNTMVGIVTWGTGNTIRRNAIVATGGAAFDGAHVHGIRALGPATRILDNDVTDTYGVGSGQGVGIVVDDDATGSVVEGNRVGVGTSGGNTTGVSVETGTEVFVLRNRIMRTGTGIRFQPGAAGTYRANLTSGTTTPFVGGTDAGGNN
jgi:ELWxxDGT repeat protein